jgi:hypothetical protein
MLKVKFKVTAKGEDAVKKAMKHGLIPRPPKKNERKEE